MTRPNSLPLLPSLGCAILFFFVFWVSWFFVFWFVVGFSAIAKQKPNPNKKKKTRKQKRQKNKEKKHYSPLGVCNLVFFVVFCCLVSWSLVFWFVVGFLKGWQNNTKVKDLDLTLCQFSHFRGCKFTFGYFWLFPLFALGLWFH